MIPRQVPGMNNEPVSKKNAPQSCDTMPYKQLFEAAMDGMVLVSGETGRIREVNRSFVVLSGYSPKELVEKLLWEIGPMQQTDAGMVAFQELQDRDHIYYDDLPLVRHDGKRISVEFACSMHREGGTKLIQCTFRDITRRKEAEEELWTAETRFKALFRNAPVGIAFVDAQGRISECNGALISMLGYNENELRGTHFSQISHPDDRDEDNVLFQELVDGKRESYHLAGRCIRKDGKTVWGLLGSALVRGPKQDVRFLIRMVEDITERKQAEERVIRSRDFYRSLINELPNPIRLADTDGNFDYFNRSWLDFTGRRMELQLGDAWAEGIHPEDRGRVLNLFREAFTVRSPFSAEYRLHRTDDEFRWVIEFGNPYNGIDGQFAGYISSCYDIHERKALESALQSISITDDLTGLLNRRGFFTLAQQQIKISNRSKRALLLVYADLDGLKHINDTLGHAAGDRMLIETATILKDVFRESDIIARLGGDEFAVLITEETGLFDEGAVMGRLKEAILASNVRSPGRHPLSLSAGIQRYDPDNPSSLDKLISNADGLMYEEKKAKKRL